MWSRRIPAVAMLVAVAWFGATGVAAAHDGLVHSTPADGQSVDSSPAVVELEFTGDPQSLGDGTAVVVTNSAGRTVSTGEAAIDGTFVREALLPDLVDGEYLVSYRVISSDGHEVEGSTRFYVGPVTPVISGHPFGFDVPEDGSNVPAIVIGIVGAFVVITVALLVLRRFRQRPSAL